MQGDHVPSTPDTALAAAGLEAFAVVAPGTPLTVARLAEPGRIPKTPLAWGGAGGYAAGPTPPKWKADREIPRPPHPPPDDDTSTM
eukprot:12916915-Prorocentrum_lima.AAC.1